MKPALKYLYAIATMSLMAACTAFGQLQWSAYDTSGNLVTANVATGGSIGSGSVTFTIPANTQLSFVTKNFAPINLATPTAKKTVTFNVSVSGAFGGVAQRTMGWGLYNSAGTAGFTDDAGFFGLWNGGGPYLETYDHTSGNANLFTGTHLGQGTVNSGTPSDGVTYTNQIQLNMNSAGSAISLGTSSSTLAAAGLGMNGVSVTERAYTNPDGAITATSFDEFVFMFNNTTASPVTVTLSAVSLVNTVTWDASGTTPLAPTDGNGTWSVTNANWSNGSVDNGWTDGQNAVLGSGGAPGIITIPTGNTVTVGNLTFNTNYTITGGTMVYTNFPTNTVVGAATAATNSAVMTGTGFTKTGDGTLTFAVAAANTFTGLVTIANGTLFAASPNNSINISGDLLVNSNGIFRYSQNSMIAPTSTLIVNGGLVTNITASTVLTVNKLILENNGLIADASGNAYCNATNYDVRSGRIFSSRYRIGAMSTFKSTAGTVVITNRPNASATDGHLVTMNAGTLIFDKSSQNANRLLANGALTLGGGFLVFSNGNSALNPSTENPGTGGTFIIPGASSVMSTNPAPATGGAITFGAFTRRTGGTLDFFKNAAGGSTTTSANVNGIQGGWATWNKTDWLTGTTLAAYASYTTSSDATTWAAANNVSLAGNPLANLDDVTINSLRLTAASTVTLNSTKTLTLSSGGLLVTGSGATTITGGNLKSGLAGGDLIIHQYSSTDMTIASDLSDNSTSSLTKSGTGKVILTGANNMTGTNFLNGGIVEVSSLAKLAAGPLVMNAATLRYTGSDATENRAVTLNGLGGVLDVPPGITLTLGNAIKGSGATIGDLGGLTKVGNGTLALGASNYFNGPMIASNGVLTVNGTNAYDLNTWDAGKVTVYATLSGSGVISGPVTVKNGGTLAPGNTVGTLTLRTNVTFESGSRVLLDVTNGAADDVLAIQGNLVIQPNTTLAINALGSTLQVTTNTVITYGGSKTGSFNPTVAIAGGTFNGSLFVDESTAGQIKFVLSPVVVITNQPADTIVSVGDTATLTVVATGAAPLTYQWYSYGNSSNNVPTAIADETNASYTINNAQSSNSGYYSVVVANGSSSVTSRITQLIVGNVAPVISGPTNLTVIAGNNATFNVSVSIANPAPTFQWQTNGVDVTGATGSSLTLTNVSFGLDGATVSVIANNIAGSATNSATITVIVPPVISPQLTNITANAGTTVSFVSGATGVPTPGLQWYKNGTAIPGETGSTLTIANVQGSNIGNYYVVATNLAGSAISSTGRLTVISTTLASTAFTPTNGATGVCYDTPLYITFNGPVSIVNSGRIRIYNSTNAFTPVDTIDMGANTVVVSGSINVTNNIQPHSLFPGDSQVINYFPVIITGNTAAIYPHGGVMTNNQTYYVTMESGVVKDSNGAYFTGISDTNAWVFTTKATGPANATNLVVAADGTGDFATVQGAVDSVPAGNTAYTLINVHDGTYTEIVDISGKNNITFRGQSRTGTIIGYGNNNNLTGTTAGRMAFKVNGADIKLDNLTIVNTTPQGGSQAEALLVYNSGLRCVINNCDIYSRQDTLLINATTSQAYFNNCKVIGNFDYIWGSGVAYFNNCLFHTLTNTLSGSYNLTAARTGTSAALSATTPWVNPNGTTFSAYGFTFVSCTFEADDGVTGITLAGSNGTAGGLDAWTFCKFSAAYVTPTTTLSNSYVFWQYQNTDTNNNPISYANVQTIGVTNNDPRLLAATNVPTWFSSWTPTLAPNITSQPTNLTVNAGSAAAFSVTATAIPDATYQWLQNGTNSPYSANSPTLTIPSAQSADAGNYSVVIANSAGTVTSSVVTLTVVVPTPPTINGAPQLQNDGNIQISFSGSSGSAYRVWASTNLTLTPITSTWDLVSSGTFGASPVTFTDLNATNYPQRFYIISSP